MATEMRFIGVSLDLDTQTPTLDLAVGKGDRIRRLPLSEFQLLLLISQSASQLHLLHKKREELALRSSTNR